MDDKVVSLMERAMGLVQETHVDAAKPTWATKLACDDLAAARALAEEHPTYENLVNVQRLERIANEEAKKQRTVFTLVTGDKPCR